MLKQKHHNLNKWILFVVKERWIIPLDVIEKELGYLRKYKLPYKIDNNNRGLVRLNFTKTFNDVNVFIEVVTLLISLKHDYGQYNDDKHYKKVRFMKKKAREKNGN